MYLHDAVLDFEQPIFLKRSSNGKTIYLKHTDNSFDIWMVEGSLFNDDDVEANDWEILDKQPRSQSGMGNRIIVS